VVNVNFTPLAPGLRRGAVVISDDAGNVLASVPIYGNGTGPQAAYAPAAIANVATSLSSPYGLAVDAAGDLFVGDSGNGQVWKVTPAGSTSVVATGIYKPSGLALDGAGNLWIADPIAHTIWKITPAGAQTQPLTGLANPYGLAFDGAGNLYFCDSSLDHILKISPQGVQTSLGSNFNFPAGVAVDNTGNAYIADVGNNEIHKVTPSGVVTTFASGLNLPANVAVDASGNVYVTEFGNGQILEITSAGAQTTFVSNATNPFGMAIDNSGNLFYSDSATGIAAKITRAQPSAFSFVNTPIGTTSTDSPKTVSVENIGNASLNFSAIAYPSDFPENSGALDDCSVSSSLIAGTTCALTIDFTPLKALPAKSTIAPLSESVSVTSNTLNISGTQQTVTVSGDEIPAAASVPLIVTLHPAARTYGSPNPTFGYTITGLLNGDTVVITPQTSATVTSPVGTYPVNAIVSGPDAAHYTITVYATTLQILKAALYISANNVAVTYGQTPIQPTFYTLHGFLNDDTASVVSGAPVLTSTVTATTPVGFYPIGVQVGTLSAANYSFLTTYSGQGTVGVYKAPLLVSANNFTMTQGSSVPTLTYTITGFVNGDSSSVVTGAASLSTAATSATKAGRYLINTSPGTLAATNYTFGFASGVLTVNP